MSKQVSQLPAQKKFVPRVAREFYYTAEELPQEQSADESSSTFQDFLDEARLRDIDARYITRVALTVLFMLLLFAQNVVVFYFVYLALTLNRLSALQLIFSTLIAATLTETYFVIKIIVNYMFQTEDYTYKKNQIASNKQN